MSLNVRRARRRRRLRDSYTTGSDLSPLPLGEVGWGSRLCRDSDRIIFHLSFDIWYWLISIGRGHVTFANLQIRNIDRGSRRHSFVLTCACVALLLFNSPFPKNRWRILAW